MSMTIEQINHVKDALREIKDIADELGGISDTLLMLSGDDVTVNRNKLQLKTSRMDCDLRSACDDIREALEEE